MLRNEAKVSEHCPGVRYPGVTPAEHLMPTKKLTDLFAERVPLPTQGRIEYFDATFGGLSLRVTAQGNKSWSLFYRMGGKLRRLTLGQFPAIKPAQARREAGAALERVRLGIDPAEEKRDRRLASEADTFARALEEYLAHASRHWAASTLKETKRVLEREPLRAWRDRPLSSISRADVVRLLDAIVAAGAEIGANRTLAYLRALFNWAVKRGRLLSSPVSGVDAPTKERTRDRVLSDDELRWLWRACEKIDWPFGPLVKLLLLTGQRRDEVATLRWSELDFDKRTWTLPREKAKNNRAHEIHVSDAAIEVLRSLPRTGALLFTSTGSTAVSGFSRAKRRLDVAMFAAKSDQPSAPCEPIPPWVLHDLRRTTATGMARLNFPPHVVDKVLNHVSGTIRGVAAVYNRFEYLEERRAALEAWGRYVENITTPSTPKVVALRGQTK
jgi:integrase